MKKKYLLYFLFILIAAVFLFAVVEEAEAYCPGMSQSKCKEAREGQGKSGDGGWKGGGKNTKTGGCAVSNEACGGGGPPPCKPSCGECGPNGCGGTCKDTCGNYKSGCTAKKCTYFDASLTSNVDTPCISQKLNSREFTVSGRSKYCGEVKIKVKDSNGDNIIPVKTAATTDKFGDYTYSETLSLPADYLLSPEPAITIIVVGDRQATKDTKDEPNYAETCKKELHLELDYKNFFYCPVNPESRIDVTIYDYYDDSDHYEFNGGLTYNQWDSDTSCTSEDSINLCSPGPTNCIDDSGAKVNRGKAADADSDGEIEVCLSRDGIQGGWIDADINAAACQKVNDVPSRVAKWYDCPNPSDRECAEGIDDFPTDQKGLCCGDDQGEGPLDTKFSYPGSTSFLIVDGDELSHDACCDVSDPTQGSCVDEVGFCRSVGYDTCFTSLSVADTGFRGTCKKNSLDDYYWELVEDPFCMGVCQKCDVNDDDVVDITDITAIQLNATDPNDPSPVIDPIYDIDGNGVVDESDWERCSMEDVFLFQCNSCESFVDDGANVCADVDGTIKFGQPDPYLCSENDGNYTVRVRDETYCGPACDMKYDTDSCKTAACGGCEADTDCSGNLVCDSSLCACNIYEPGREYSIHINETDCGYMFCISGDSSTPANETTVGYIRTQTNFTEVQAKYFEDADEFTIVDNEIWYVMETKNHQDCMYFQTDGEVSYGFADDGHPSVDKIYFEPTDAHPSSVPFTYSTSPSNSCRVCIADEEYEVTLNDGRDNDCDGLVDEPYFDGYGVYIWESNCDYYMCVYSDELVDMITYGRVSTETSFSDIKTLDWETNVDTLSVDSANTVFDFRSRINYDLDCIIMNTDAIMNFALNLSGVDGTDNIYLKQVKMNPLTNPFYFSSPTCALGCETPGMCGEEKQVLISTIKVGCSYDECIFDCGGHWMDVESTYDSIPASLLDSPEDYCAACEADMACSDYTNEYSCHYNPCSASETRFGCEWDNDGTCFDPFEPCMPGTTLCSDGICKEDCAADDTNIAYCYGYPDDVCEVGEGCACPDCVDDQASCTDGAVCDDNMICGCPLGTTLCEDKTCSDDCEDSDKQGCIDTNGLCELGEGCTCIDCNAQQDSCVYGAVCSRYDEVCIELQIEQCKVGEALCEDFSCDETCTDNGGKRGCVGDPNEICEYGEGCECSDCYNKQDSCKVGLVCDDDDYVCRSTSSGGGSVTDDDCVDLDNDGYSKLDSDCAGSSDCDDTDETINVAAIEACGNQIDDNCDGTVDEDCVSSIDVSVGEMDSIRVFNSFDLVVNVNNKLPYEVKKVKLDMDLPKGISAKKQAYNIFDLASNDEATETMRIYIRDYELEGAILELNIDVDGETVTKEIELDVEIPEFLVAADPIDIDSGATCYNLYYVVNMGEVKGDIELNVIDPDAFLSKTALVDYIRGVDTTGVVMEELVSNPYCLPQRKNYEVQGYFYKANSGLFIDKSIKSDQSLVDESVAQIVINIDLNEV